MRMKNIWVLSLTITALSLMLAGCGGSSIPDGTVVSIIYSADTHGKLEGCGCQDGGGGVARRSGEILKARSEDETVVYCDAGNFMSGTPEVDKTQGKLAVEVYNQMKADVVNISERELAFGMDAFRAAKKDSKFDYVSANLRDNGAMLAQPFVIKKVKEARVAFIGLCGTRDVMRTDSSRLPAGITVEDPIVEARKSIVAIADKADLIVLLSTCGDETDSLIAHTLPNIDLIIGGRSFRPNPDAPWVMGKTRILRPQRDGRSIGRMDLVFGPQKTIKTYSPSVVNTQPGGPVDDKMLALVKQYIPNYADNPSGEVREASNSAAK
jgi:2',3'-cyclic-nucleotide 2'-phosphodiesterase (5'-nucleotidase family)